MSGQKHKARKTRKQLEKERAMREVEYHEARMKELDKQ